MLHKCINKKNLLHFELLTFVSVFNVLFIEFLHMQIPFSEHLQLWLKQPHQSHQGSLHVEENFEFILTCRFLFLFVHMSLQCEGTKWLERKPNSPACAALVNLTVPQNNLHNLWRVTVRADSEVKKLRCSAASMQKLHLFVEEMSLMKLQQVQERFVKLHY